MTELIFSEAEREAIAALAAHLEPGTDCPTCNRRVPYPPQPASPPTKKKGYWVPADEYEAHEDVLAVAAKFLGVYEQPFWEFKTATLALTLVLQDESLKGFGGHA